MTKIMRTSALTCRHIDLGGNLEEYIRMAVPMTYSTDPQDEHDAVRNAAGMYDLTAFLKFYVRGKDAVKALNHAMTHDMTKLKPGQAKYGPFLRDDGTICDDGIAFNMGNDEYLVWHGDGCARKMVEASCEGLDAEVDVDDAVHLISLQGPIAHEFLDKHTPMDVPSLKYFHHQDTELFGYPCTLSRTGFSGERGYEIFARPDVICAIWDKIYEEGKEFGIMPCSLSSIFTLRIEAGLVWRRFDLMEKTPYEVGLGWCVNPKKEADYRGKDAVLAAKGKERFHLCGIEADINVALAGGEKLMLDGKEVGTVNGKPAYSKNLDKSLAFVCLQPDHTAVGTELEVVGESGSCKATVVSFPVYDPKKERVKAM